MKNFRRSQEKNSVFISYSRVDKDFAYLLEQKLRAEQREVWIDKSKLIGGDKWWKDICQNILSNDVFVAILSPNFVASPACNLEMLQARLLNKGIVPISYKDINEGKRLDSLSERKLDAFEEKQITEFNQGSIEKIASDNWLYIRPINWVRIRSERELNRRQRALSRILDTDLSYVRMHSWVLRRANEWDNSKRINSALLRGEELSKTNKWLLASEGQKPEPTELQTIFITRSSVIERRRLALIAIAAIVLVFLLAIGLLAIQRANDENRLKLISNAFSQRTIASNQYFIGAYQISKNDYIQAFDTLRQLEPTTSKDDWTVFATEDYRSKGIEIDEWLKDFSKANAQLQDYKSAEQNLLDAIRANPNNIDAYLLLIDVYSEDKNIPAANDLFKQATDIHSKLPADPNDPLLIKIDIMRGKLLVMSKDSKDINNGIVLLKNYASSIPLDGGATGISLSSYYLQMVYYAGRGYQALEALGIDTKNEPCRTWRKAEMAQLSSPPSVPLLWLNRMLIEMNTARKTCPT